MIEEKNVQILLEDFVSEIEPSEKLRAAVNNFKAPAIPRRPKAFSFAAAVLGTAIVAVAIFFPRHVYAGSISKISQAIFNARSMEVDITLYCPDGAPRHRIQSFYKEGKWRDDFHMTGRPETYIRRDHKVYTYWSSKRFASVEDFKNEGFLPRLTGLEFARELAEEGSSSSPVTRTIVSNPYVAGRPTYAVIADRSTDHLHSVMVVDKGTDLPLSVDVSFNLPGSTKGTRTHANFKFNIPIEDSRFEPTFGVPIVDIRAEKLKYLASWARPIATFNGKNSTTCVNDAQVNQQGWVFLVESGNREEFPNILGGTYVRVELDLNAGQNRLCVFVPFRGKVAPPPTLTLAASGTTESVSAGKPIQDLPTYLPVFNVNAEASLGEQILWTRATRYYQMGDYKNALPIFQEQYELMLQTFPWDAWCPLQKVADCQKRLGLSGNEDTLKKAKAIEQFDPRAPINPKTIHSPRAKP